MWGWLGAVEALGIVVVLAVALLALLAGRQRWLGRQGGTFECSLRLRTSTPGAGWALGVGRYNRGRLEWFRFFSLSVRPRQSFPRGGVRVLETRGPDLVEAVSLSADQRIVGLAVLDPEPTRGGATPVVPPVETRRELAMSADSVTGLMAWLEAAPPGVMAR